MMAVYNLSDYLPLSVEYAAGVGQECDIVEYNRSYYSRAGLITSSIMAILGIVFAFFGEYRKRVFMQECAVGVRPRGFT